MKEIKEITTKSLNNASHFTFHSDFLRALDGDSFVMAQVATQLVAYRTALSKEEKAFTISQKSLKTDEINQADQERDTLYTGLKKMVDSYAHLPNLDTQKAQKVLAQLIKDYGIKTTLPMDEETGLLVNFIQDLDQKYTNEVQVLGLANFIAPLKAANEKVRTALSERTGERSVIEAGAMKTARAEVDEAYRTLVKFINACALIEGETNYGAFIDWANEHIARFKKQTTKKTEKAE